MELKVLAIFTLALCVGVAAFAKDLPPPTSERPWAPPRLDQYERELAQRTVREKSDRAHPSLGPRRIYALPELIDLAQRNNPETRVAWERARQTAAAIGLSESSYFPYLVASAGTGYERAFIPFPRLRVDQGPIVQQIEQSLPAFAANPQAALRTLDTQSPTLPNVSIVGGGSLVTDAVASRAALSVKRLLFDFGERRAGVDAAKERLMQWLGPRGKNAVSVEGLGWIKVTLY